MRGACLVCSRSGSPPDGGFQPHPRAVRLLGEQPNGLHSRLRLSQCRSIAGTRGPGTVASSGRRVPLYSVRGCAEIRRAGATRT